jgi:hypothetical protein
MKRMPVLNMIRGWDTAVITATAYGLDNEVVRVQVPIQSRIFPYPYLGLTQPPIQLVPEALTKGVKQPGCEGDHSPPTSAEVKKTCI